MPASASTSSTARSPRYCRAVTLLRRWWPELVLSAAFAGLTAVLWSGHWLGVDVTVTHWCDAHRPPVADWLAPKGNHPRPGGYLTPPCLGLAPGPGWRRRPVP